MSNSAISASSRRKRPLLDGGGACASPNQAKAAKHNDDELYLDIAGLLSAEHNIDANVSMNITRLLEDDHKVSFIARYRKSHTCNMQPQQLKQLADSYHSLVELQSSVGKAFKRLKNEEQITPDLRSALKSVTSKTELETIMEPFKKSPRTTLAARARALGLETAAVELLAGSARWRPECLVQIGVGGRDSVKAVVDSVGHIVCEMISKDAEVHLQVMSLDSHPGIDLLTSAKTVKASDAKPRDADKFARYTNFHKRVQAVAAHEYLAICRAEERKIISVKVELPDELRHRFVGFCRRKFIQQASVVHDSAERTSLLARCIDDTYGKHVSRAVHRHVRAALRRCAENAAVRVISRNLSAKLLTRPVSGRTILALDPGYNACKLAVVSAQGAVLYTGVVQPRLPRSAAEASRLLATGDREDCTAPVLRQLINQHSVSLIGIGNGCACRETWLYVCTLNSSGRLCQRPLDVTVVDENGVSEYSASECAAAEMPQLDCTVRSAVSLARRLQNPISEFVKVDPSSLGVGMYQKDLSSSRLSGVLSECVEHAVATVGVDINMASLQLLARVPGLNVARAKSIIEKRESRGVFTNREQLKEIKGIGPKSFQQCAGFVKILPETVNTSSKVMSVITPKRKLKKKAAAIESSSSSSLSLCRLEPLDATIIHPESYALALRLIKLAQCERLEIGCTEMTSRLASYIAGDGGGEEQLCTALSTDVYTLQLIVGALTNPRLDARDTEGSAPLFFQSMVSADQLIVGRLVQAVVRNPTDFGAFIDLGIGENVLLHRSQMGSTTELKVNDRVEVRVIAAASIHNKPSVSRNDVQLRLVRVLNV